MADIERSTAAAPAPVAHADIESLPALFGRLGDDVVKLLDAKFSLLKEEVKDDANVYVRGAVMIGIGGVVAAVGFALVNVAIAFFVSKLFTSDDPRINYALGFLVTGALYLVIGGILIVVMKNRLAARNPVPERTIDELGKDKQWLKKEI
ncbi:MAG: phage holin family protein [Pyrinomonadaceae bacterium]